MIASENDELNAEALGRYGSRIERAAQNGAEYIADKHIEVHVTTTTRWNANGHQKWNPKAEYLERIIKVKS